MWTASSYLPETVSVWAILRVAPVLCKYPRQCFHMTAEDGCGTWWRSRVVKALRGCCVVVGSGDSGAACVGDRLRMTSSPLVGEGGSWRFWGKLWWRTSQDHDAQHAAQDPPDPPPAPRTTMLNMRPRAPGRTFLVEIFNER